MKVAIIVLVCIVIVGMVIYISNPEAVCATQENCTYQGK